MKKNTKPRNKRSSGQPEPRALKSWSDRLAADCADELTGTRVLVVLMHGTTLATALRESRPDLTFTFFTPEHFFLRTLQRFHESLAADYDSSPDLLCAAELPDQVFDAAVFSTSTGDSSEVAQEMMQAIQSRLKPDGKLIVSTNNPRDRWIQSQLKGLFANVDIRKHKHGVVCVGERILPLRKLRGFRARFGFRHLDRVLLCETRPGVFSHRRLDGGARALIRSLTMLKDDGLLRMPPQKIVEIGSGCGAVSVAAATSFPEASVLAVDSDARAVDCTQRSAALNSLTNITTLLTSDGAVPEPGTWDLLLGNPPYYSDFRIAELFLQAAKKSLRPGGAVHIVSKPTEWQQARMQQLFADVQAHKIGEYTVFTGRQKGESR